MWQHWGQSLRSMTALLWHGLAVSLSLSLCVSVCLLAMSVSFAKRAELIKMPFVPRTQ